MPRLKVAKLRHDKGLSEDSTYINSGGNSGYQAINLAVNLGFNQIILLGYDMTGVGTHFFGEHTAKGLQKNTNYSSFRSEFSTIKPELRGAEIINCSRKSSLNCFIRDDLEKYV